MIKEFIAMGFTAGIAGYSAILLAHHNMPQPRPEMIRVPYAIVEDRPEVDISLTPVALLGVMNPDDDWATTFATYDTLAACEAELGDTAYLYREQWPMAVMWCAVNGGPVAIVRPQPRPEELK